MLVCTSEKMNVNNTDMEIQAREFVTHLDHLFGRHSFLDVVDRFDNVVPHEKGRYDSHNR